MVTSEPSRFAPTDEDAAARYETWKVKDPFPEIPAALLNSADFLDYVAATGLIWPFDDADETRLKPASYLVAMVGPFTYWDGEGNLRSGELQHGDTFELPRNTIAFVTLEPTFRLPDYIALRFNLQIKYIHAGLLVGTGPLVDPGFTGRLYVPLHNLTDNDYSLVVDDGLVWMEFTKVSPLARWREWEESGSRDVGSPLPARSGTYHAFPESKKKRQTQSQYLHAAYPGKIRSSIPTELGRTSAYVQRLSRVGLVAIIGIGITLIGIMVGVLTLVLGAHSLVESARQNAPTDVTQLTQRVTQLEEEVARLQHVLDARTTPSPAQTP